MTVSPEDDFAASEFALGTLDAGERAALAARRLREPELDAAIRAWEERLAPLAEAAPPIDPPHDYLAAIEARLGAAAPARGGAAESEAVVIDLQQRLSRWRNSAIAATSLAALLAIGVVTREATRSEAPTEFVAVLQKSADLPAFVASIDLKTRELTVRPLAAPPQAGKSYELWIIEAKLGAPRSLGVIDPADLTRNLQLAVYDRAVLEDATYAVTVEPPGGSPNGTPSGPPVFQGKLVPVGP
jgi:anti-sigma-K factor RskA